MHDDQAIRVDDAGVRETRGDAGRGAPIDWHLDRLRVGAGRGHAERREEIPLVPHRVTRSQLAWPRDASRVHPRASDHLVTDANRRAAQPREQRGAGSAVKVDRDVERRSPKPSHEGDLGAPGRGAAMPRRDDDVIYMWILRDHRLSRRLDDVRDMRGGKAFTDGFDGRRREDDVADLPQADEQQTRESDEMLSGRVGDRRL